MSDFTLPELGENVTTGDVLRVLVKPGDTIANDQPVLELETDKATIEVPSSVAGRVTDVKVKAGDKVKVGQVVLSVDDATGGEVAPEQKEKAQKADKEEPAKAEKPAAQPAAEKKPEPAKNAPAKEASEKQKPVETPDPEGDANVDADAEADDAVSAGSDDRDHTQAEGAPRGQKVVDISRGTRAGTEPAAAPADRHAQTAPTDDSRGDLPPAPAAPSVRRLARELGVDVNTVQGSGTDGRISLEDVKGHAKRLVEGASSGGPAGSAEPLPDFSRWGAIDRQPMRAVRRKTAEHLSHAWATIPHVTQHELADVTALEELRERYGKTVEAAGGHLTITAIAVKVVAAALKVFPQLNASIDLAAQEIIYKKYIHIGVAVDTDRGLLVPVIRDADTKNITQLSVELADLSEKARSRKLSLDQMQGGSFSISNLGGIGGTFFTPIVNAPEVAILGISRARMEPVYAGGGQGSPEGAGVGQFVPRLMLPLSLSYDHRAIDGADGIRFLRWIVDALERPFLLALQG